MAARDDEDGSLQIFAINAQHCLHIDKQRCEQRTGCEQGDGTMANSLMHDVWRWMWRTILSSKGYLNRTIPTLTHSQFRVLPLPEKGPLSV